MKNHKNQFTKFTQQQNKNKSINPMRSCVIISTVLQQGFCTNPCHAPHLTSQAGRNPCCAFQCETNANKRESQMSDRRCAQPFAIGLWRNNGIVQSITLCQVWFLALGFAAHWWVHLWEARLCRVQVSAVHLSQVHLFPERE